MLAHTTRHDDPIFRAFAKTVRNRFWDGTRDPKVKLFRTRHDEIFTAYLDALAPEERQYHTCSCCRSFLNRYGSLVAIDEQGAARSVLWGDGDGVPAMYAQADRWLKSIVENAPVEGVFLSKERVWGTPEAGGFDHFGFVVPDHIPYRGIVLSAGEAMAEKREHHRILSEALASYTPEVVAQALNLLQADALYRSEKVIGPAQFLHDLHMSRKGVRNAARSRNLVWRAVGWAPAGFCTPRSGMIGTLLDDIASGLDFEAVKKRFAAKMHPLQYQRPQAAPAAGNIARAEKIVAEMGLEPALRRRFARIEEVELIWRPEPDPTPSSEGGVFGHLVPKGKTSPPAIEMEPQTITWVRFARDVLPKARSIAVRTTGVMNIAGTLTAEDPEAPPILQWDRPEARNPVSQFVYVAGSPPAKWSLPGDAWVEVTGVMLAPHLWHGELEHQGRRATLILKGAIHRDESALCLFPEILKSELHPVRSTIEAYSKSRTTTGAPEGSANGLLIGDSGTIKNRIRVTTDLGVAIYIIDRWE